MQKIEGTIILSNYYILYYIHIIIYIKIKKNKKTLNVERRFFFSRRSENPNYVLERRISMRGPSMFIIVFKYR